jgi:CheY-like chemotaxis protein
VTSPRVLAVDDVAPALEELRRLLLESPEVADVAVAGDAITALRRIQAGPFDVVLLDISMPGMEGMELAGLLARMTDPPAVVFVTAYDEHAAAAYGLGAVDYLLKPVSAERLGAALTRVRHIIVRFHTSSDGRGARRTAAITVALLGAFYLFPGVYGLLGAVLLPELYLSGGTDTVVVALPARVDQGPVGSLFTALLTAGAFAAFLATSLGLLLAVSGALSHDLVPGTLRRLRFTPLAAAGAVVLLALPAASLDVGVLVTSAFAVAASTFCPLLVLGIWWPRLTAAGAVVGMVVGLLASAGAIGVDLFLALPPGLGAILLSQPAVWSVPIAFATMVLVSLAGRPPAWAAAAMLRLHLDESEFRGRDR